MKLNESHYLNDFDCGDEDLNDFLKNDALKQQNEKLNVTKLIIFDKKIIGYVSLLTDTLLLKNIRDEDLKMDIRGMLNVNSKNKQLPAVKIGRFAIDKKYSRLGLGSDILLNIINNVKKIADNDVGLRFVVVEGYAQAYDFYARKNNFIHLKKDDDLIKEKLDLIVRQNPKQTFYLYLDLKKY